MADSTLIRAARASFKTRIALPFNAAFLRGVDLRQLRAFVEEEDLHVVEEKAMRVRVGKV